MKQFYEYRKNRFETVAAYVYIALLAYIIYRLYMEVAIVRLVVVLWLYKFILCKSDAVLPD